MEIKKISTDKAPAAIGPYSQAMVIGNMLYTSGQIPIDPATGNFVGTTVAEQAEQVMKNLSAVLEAAGSSFDKVIKTTCFLTESSDFAPFNEVYAKYMTSLPARSCVFVKALPRVLFARLSLLLLSDRSKKYPVWNFHTGYCYFALFFDY
jgi:2-iminobutanoate/2-iminopropanoate deaminase